jgi:DNA-binding Lrp family transcriptional regulator
MPIGSNFIQIFLLMSEPLEKYPAQSPRGKRSIRPLDPTDRRLLALLQANAKATMKELAAALGLTVTPVYERIRRLEREGAIKGYRAVLDREQLGLPFMALCEVQLKEHTRTYIRQFEEEIQTLPEVTACFHTAGTFDYLLHILVEDMEAYQYFIVEKLAALGNIGRVQSAFVLHVIKEEQGLPIA